VFLADLPTVQRSDIGQRQG